MLIMLLNSIEQTFSKEVKIRCRYNLSHLDFLTKIYANCT